MLPVRIVAKTFLNCLNVFAYFKPLPIQKQVLENIFPTDAIFVKLDPTYSLPSQVKLKHGLGCLNSVIVDTFEAEEFVLENVSAGGCAKIEVHAVPNPVAGGEVRFVEIQTLSGP